MIKETIAYENIDGEKDSIDAYFNLNTTELGVFIKSDAYNRLTEIISKLREYSANEDHTTEDTQEVLADLYEVIKYIAKLSYGRRVTDADGTHPRFVKNPKDTEDFINSDVFDAFFTNMINSDNAEGLDKFISGLTPKGLRSDVAKQIESAEGNSFEEKIKNSTGIDLGSLSDEERKTLVNYISNK